MRRLRRRSPADRDQGGAAALAQIGARHPRARNHRDVVPLRAVDDDERLDSLGPNSVDGQGMFGRIGIAFPEVKRNFGKRTLLPLFGFREPEALSLGIM